MAKGRKTGGGSRKGIPNKAPSKSAVAAQLADKAAAAGVTPLEYMLGVLRDEKAEPHERFEAAKAAAPYCHSKLQSIEHKGDKDQPIEMKWTVEIVRPAPRA